ncbi:MAG: DEAD/DEAH box helicase, partial [Candidatus Micrarchaeota archaeon]
MTLNGSLFKNTAEERDYQVKAAEEAVEKGNSLVVMPTALGKTFVALLVMAHLIAETRKKVLFLVPTKPLALQQAARIREHLHLHDDAVVVLTGEVPPEQRSELWKNAAVVCATPQTVQHDLLVRKFSLDDYCLVVFDEAHRAVGDYAYAFIGQQVQKSGVLILGLTASPSSQREKIDEVCRNLGIKHVVVKREHDSDVKPFVNKVRVDWVFVELPRDFLELRNGLQDVLRDCMNSLKNEGFVDSVAVARVNKRTLLELRTKVLAETKSNVRAYQALSHVARAINVLHASDLLESHGLAALNDYLHGLKTRKQKTKAVQNLLSDFRIARVAVKTQSLLAAGVEHPKMQRMKEIVSGETALGKSVIVFAHYRDSVKRIVTELNSIAGVSARELVGRADGGMTQKKQAAVIEGFRNREFNV